MMEEIVFKNPIGLSKHWGSAKPYHLAAIIQQLNLDGFYGSISWKKPSFLIFEKEIDGDIFVRVILATFGGAVSGQFNFDAHILLCSKYVAHIESTLNLWNRSFDVAEHVDNEPYECLWSIDLSHLKWNAVSCDRNPYWKVSSENPTVDEVRCDWLADWNAYGKPYLNEMKDALSVVKKLLYIPHYQRNPWVKSSGPTNVSVYENAAILLIRLNQYAEAERILNKLQSEVNLHISQNGAMPGIKAQARAIELLLDWMQGVAD
jgi:hypothetical protein